MFSQKILPLVRLLYIHFKMSMSLFKQTYISSSLIGFIPLRLLMTLPTKWRDTSACDTKRLR